MVLKIGKLQLSPTRLELRVTLSNPTKETVLIGRSHRYRWDFKSKVLGIII